MQTKNVVSLLMSVLLAAPVVDAKSKRKPANNDRPPQFVLFAFDGSLANDFWDESFNFADSVPVRDMNDEMNGKLRFSYFVNPVYYIAKDNRGSYNTPGISTKDNPRHLSCINWSNGLETIVPRIDKTNRAFLAGHEIGSHANSHCDASGVDKNNPMYGHAWTQANWESEFSQFNKLLFGSYNINGLTPSKSSSKYPGGFAFNKSDIVGFRAPQLAVTDGLWPALGKNGFRYDTSKVSAPGYWPQKQTWGDQSGWNFPLANIKIAGSPKKTLSMDYNWLCFHSGCSSKEGLTSADVLRFKTQMLDSYKYYFKINYFGGRGPVHIGHHFSKWNGGAYWQAMQEFAKFVCSKPEVRCVTYRQYADWLDGLSPNTYETYRSGNFTKMRDDGTIKDIATPVLADVRLDMGNNAFEAVVSESDRAKLPVMGWKPQLRINYQPQASTKITKDQLVQQVGVGKTVFVRASLVNRSGAELDWSTYRIDKLGTPEESITDALEKRAEMGEGADAHEMGE